MKLLICGDLCATNQSFDAFNATDEVRAFNDTLPIIRSADRAIVNLECALTDSENSIKKFGPNLKSPINTADTLKKAGFTDIMLSNNHVFDFGIEGLCDTVKELKRCGFYYTGIGDNYEDSRKNHTIELDGIRACIINVCEHEYTYATDKRCGARPFDEFETMDDIRKAKRVHDKVIVIYHGGKEYCKYPSPRLLKACREMVRCGADAVLCQHSHCIGTYELFEGGHILYGQGNFHFLSKEDADFWKEGLMVMLDVNKDSIDIDFIPVKETADGIRIATDEEKASIFNEMNERAKSISDGSYKDKFNEFCQTINEEYMGVIGYTPSSLPKDYQHFAHFLDCEAHTDVLRELFKTWNETNR